MRPFALTGVITALLALSAAAQDAVEIKLAKPKAGDRYKVTKTEKTKNVQATDIGGTKKSKETDETKDVVYTEEVVTAGAGEAKPVKLVRTYSKHEDKTGKDRPAPPLDAAITVEKKDGKYTFSSAGKPLGGFAKTLEDEFNKPDDEPTTKDFLPGKAVKPGDTWTIDPAKFAKSFGDKLSVDAKKSVMSGKLLKTYTKDGKQFGVLELKAEFPITDLGKDAPPLKSAVMTIAVTADVCIDGSSFAESSRSLVRFDLLVDTKGVYLSIKSDGVLTDTREPLPKR